MAFRSTGKGMGEGGLGVLGVGIKNKKLGEIFKNMTLRTMCDTLIILHCILRGC